MRVAAAAPELVDSLTVIEPEAYALLRMQNPDAYTQICGLRDRWRAHVRAAHPPRTAHPRPPYRDRALSTVSI